MFGMAPAKTGFIPSDITGKRFIISFFGRANVNKIVKRIANIGTTNSENLASVSTPSFTA